MLGGVVAAVTLIEAFARAYNWFGYFFIRH
jgi:hypothetical protein